MLALLLAEAELVRDGSKRRQQEHWWRRATFP